jgi:trans-aconitate 2-methyltransferase
MTGPERERPDWSPALYMKFETERTRAARDLLVNVPLASARAVYDLGCGPGNGVELLQQRFPQAQVCGVDSSEAMLAHARRRAPQTCFLLRDINDWTPDRPADLIFANAALHFLPRHESLFPRLAGLLGRGGCLAVQMPNVLREASHAAMRLVAADGPWASRLVPIAKTRPVIASFEDYYAWLRPLCRAIEFWTTTYIHQLNGPDDIVDWFAGSGLRPFLDPLDENERVEFLARYRRELEQAYPVGADGKTFFSYPRLFLIATRG